MIIIGIDPGLSGGIGIIPLYDFYSSQMYSLAKFSLTDLSLLLQQFRTGESIFSSPEDKAIDNQVEIYLEEPQLPQFNSHTKGNFSVQAHKKLARSLGQLEGVCISQGYPPNLVSPTRWQGFLGCKTGGNKRLTLDLAQDIFTHMRVFTKSTLKERSKVTHSTADALLIALYGYLHYATKVPLTVQRNLDMVKIRANLAKRVPVLPSRPQMPFKRPKPVITRPSPPRRKTI
jgi:hypothetical protein